MELALKRKAGRSLSPVFAENSWENIISACQNNKVPDSWTVASQKAMTINGTDYLIDIIGIDHDVYSDGSGTAPLTFQMHRCYGTKYPMNSAGGTVGSWESCGMRTTTMPLLLELMPSEVKLAVKEVNKATSGGYYNSAATETADKLFLLSEIEIFGSTTYSRGTEGTQYDYYANGNSKGKSVTWFQRSPCRNDSEKYCYVSTSGSASRVSATSSCGVAFAFCF